MFTVFFVLFVLALLVGAIVWFFAQIPFAMNGFDQGLSDLRDLREYGGKMKPRKSLKENFHGFFPTRLSFLTPGYGIGYGLAYYVSPWLLEPLGNND